MHAIKCWRLRKNPKNDGTFGKRQKFINKKNANTNAEMHVEYVVNSLKTRRFWVCCACMGNLLNCIIHTEAFSSNINFISKTTAVGEPANQPLHSPAPFVVAVLSTLLGVPPAQQRACTTRHNK